MGRMLRAVAALTALALAGCSAGAAPLDHVLRLADGQSDYQLDPYFVGNKESGDLSTLTSAALVLWNERLEITPELLTVVPARTNGLLSRDFRRVVLHLRPNLRWSDGSPLTADDIVFTAREMTASGTVDLDDGWKSVRAIHALDANTVVVDLQISDADVIKRYLFGEMRYVLPKHVLNGVRLDRAGIFNRAPIGSGPYRYVSADRLSEIVLEANPFFVGAAPKLRRIVVKVLPDANTQLIQLQSGELDMIANLAIENLNAARAIPQARIEEVPGSDDVLNVLFNTSSAMGRDAALRRALRLGTDRLAFGALFFGNRRPVFEQVLIPEDPMHTDLPQVQYDPTTASRMLEHAGWLLGSDGVRRRGEARLALDLVAAAGDRTLDRCVEILRAQWKRLGVELRVHRELPSSLFAANGRLMQGRFDLELAQWRTPASFNDLAYSCEYAPPRGFNVGRYCDRRVEGIFARLKATDDEGARHRLYAEFERIVDASGATFNLVQLPNLTVIGPRVHGVRSTPWNFRERLQNVDVW